MAAHRLCAVVTARRYRASQFYICTSRPSSVYKDPHVPLKSIDPPACRALVCHLLGYTQHATWKAWTRRARAVLHLYREDWMHAVARSNCTPDASVIGNLEPMPLLSSSTLIILAGILTALGASERAVIAGGHLMVQQASQGMSEIKLLCLALVFVYAFLPSAGAPVQSAAVLAGLGAYDR